MSTASPTKTGSRSLLAHTQQASGVITVGSWVDVSALFSATIDIRIGRTVATALTNELLFRLEGSTASSGDDNVTKLYPRTSVTGKTAASSTTLNGATSANASTFVVTSATGILAGDTLYLREGTPANSEWVQVKSISGTTVTPFNNLVRAHTNSINIADLGELISWTQDLSSLMRVRLVIDSASDGYGVAAASGQTVDVLALMSTMDSVTIA